MRKVIFCIAFAILVRIPQTVQSIACAKAGLLTRSILKPSQVYLNITQWFIFKTCSPFKGRNLQQQELLPIYTAFPFNRHNGEPNAGAKVHHFMEIHDNY